MIRLAAVGLLLVAFSAPARAATSPQPGSLDTGFGGLGGDSAGFTTVGVDEPSGVAAVTIDSQGRILAAGTDALDGSTYFVARYKLLSCEVRCTTRWQIMLL